MKLRFPKQALVPRPPAFAATAGLTLIEIMVAVTLLAVIMTGLFAAFITAQRALTYASSQTDVLEGGRSTSSLIVRGLQELAASQQEGAVNTWATTPAGGLTMPRTDGSLQTNILQDFFFLTRQNDLWTGVGYFITVRTSGVGSQSEGMGSLYRYVNHATNTPGLDLRGLYGDFLINGVPDNPNSGHVADGIVHLAVKAFDARGEPFVPADSTNNITIWDNAPGWGFAFTNQMLPAFIDLELGMVDPKVYRQFAAMAAPIARRDYLLKQVGKVYLFRQRIPILNHHEP